MGIVWLVARLCILPQVDLSILQMPTRIQQNITPANDNHPELETIHITINDVPKNIVQPTFYQKYGLAIKWLSMIFPLVFFFIGVWMRFQRRQIILEQQKWKKAPTQWFQTQFNPPDMAFMRNQRFYETTTQLRQRLQGDIRQLDIDATVEASTRNAAPVLCYRHLSRPPEYVVLIQMKDHRDHFSIQCDALVNLLKNEDILVTQYFFYNDPRHCFQMTREKRYGLSDLYQRHADSRLIIYCDGDHFLDPFTGKLEPWLKDLLQFPSRALLTPKAPGLWRQIEVHLARYFIVLPAILDSLYAVVDYFEYPHKYSAEQWIQQGDAALPEYDMDNVHKLKKWLSPECFQWLCACAIYPELNWQLSLNLAQKLFSSGQLTETHVIQLIRLPWFIRGTIPDDVRHLLIQSLSATDGQMVRETILDMLKNNPITEADNGFDMYKLTLAFQEWSLSFGNRRLKKDFYHLLSQQPEKEIIQNVTLIKLLDTIPRNPLLFFLPRQFYNQFFKHRLPALGLRTGFRFLRTLLLIVLIFLFMPDPTPYKLPENKPRVSFEFVKIKAGKFMMGSPDSEPGRFDDEILHEVELTKDYYMQTTEVTQGQWQAVMGNNPSYFKSCGSDCPVETVSWNDAQAFIQKLNQLGQGDFRLPTEAEWEYAARAGTTTPFAFGNCLSTDAANYDGNYPLADCPKGVYRSTTVTVGSLQSNLWKLYDMHGNVYEWCSDWYAPYSSTAVVDPVGPDEGSYRVIRGGSWNGNARYCRSARRNLGSPGDTSNYLGFRLVFRLPPGR
jgi:formylglycine-generating enzyme required for sulfatase activity